MKRQSVSRIFWFLTAVLIFGTSCGDENYAIQEEIAFASEEIATEFYFDDVDDMVSIVLAAGNILIHGSADVDLLRVNDDRLECQTTYVLLNPDRELSRPEFPAGNIVIDFGYGCSDGSGNIRSGKILVRFEGKKFSAGSIVRVTFEGYMINGVELGGIRELVGLPESDIRMPKFKVTLSNGQATWPDGSYIKRENCYTREWIRAQVPLNDAMVISPCIQETTMVRGTNKRGRPYELTLVEPLMHKRSCPVAVSGIKQYTNLTTGKVITIDYGSGGCDRVVTVTVDGITRSVTIGKKL